MGAEHGEHVIGHGNGRTDVSVLLGPRVGGAPGSVTSCRSTRIVPVHAVNCEPERLAGPHTRASDEHEERPIALRGSLDDRGDLGGSIGVTFSPLGRGSLM